MPTGEPIGLTNSFGEHHAKLTRVARIRAQEQTQTYDLALPEVLARLYEFLMPLVNALQTNASFNGQWLPKTGWKV